MLLNSSESINKYNEFKKLEQRNEMQLSQISGNYPLVNLELVWNKDLQKFYPYATRVHPIRNSFSGFLKSILILLLTSLLSLPVQAQTLEGNVAVDQLNNNTVVNQIPQTAPNYLLYTTHDKLTGQVEVKTIPTLPNQAAYDDLNSNINHGIQEVGVMGIKISNNSDMIQEIYPGSDFNNFDIQPGDYLWACDGMPITNILDARTITRGIPGQVRTFTIRKPDGHWENYQIKLIPASTVKNYAQYYKFWSEQSISY